MACLRASERNQNVQEQRQGGARDLWVRHLSPLWRKFLGDLASSPSVWPPDAAKVLRERFSLAFPEWREQCPCLTRRGARALAEACHLMLSGYEAGGPPTLGEDRETRVERFTNLLIGSREDPDIFAVWMEDAAGTPAMVDPIRLLPIWDDPPSVTKPRTPSPEALWRNYLLRQDTTLIDVDLRKWLNRWARHWRAVWQREGLTDPQRAVLLALFDLGWRNMAVATDAEAAAARAWLTAVPPVDAAVDCPMPPHVTTPRDVHLHQCSHWYHTSEGPGAREWWHYGGASELWHRHLAPLWRAYFADTCGPPDRAHAASHLGAVRRAARVLQVRGPEFRCLAPKEQDIFGWLFDFLVKGYAAHAGYDSPPDDWAWMSGVGTHLLRGGEIPALVADWAAAPLPPPPPPDCNMRGAEHWDQHLSDWWTKFLQPDPAGAPSLAVPKNWDIQAAAEAWATAVQDRTCPPHHRRDLLILFGGLVKLCEKDEDTQWRAMDWLQRRAQNPDSTEPYPTRTERVKTWFSNVVRPGKSVSEQSKNRN